MPRNNHEIANIEGMNPFQMAEARAKAEHELWKLKLKADDLFKQYRPLMLEFAGLKNRIGQHEAFIIAIIREADARNQGKKIVLKVKR